MGCTTADGAHKKSEEFLAFESRSFSQDLAAGLKHLRKRLRMSRADEEDEDEQWKPEWGGEDRGRRTCPVYTNTTYVVDSDRLIRNSYSHTVYGETSVRSDKSRSRCPSLKSVGSRKSVRFRLKDGRQCGPRDSEHGRVWVESAGSPSIKPHYLDRQRRLARVTCLEPNRPHPCEYCTTKTCSRSYRRSEDSEDTIWPTCSEASCLFYTGSWN